jgi:hypothetical protein
MDLRDPLIEASAMQREALARVGRQFDDAFEAFKAAVAERADRERANPIITEHVFPPIPMRQFDWCAYRDGYEPPDSDGVGGGIVGWGRTREANPALAYEVVTGSPKRFDDTTDEEVENLHYLAHDMAVEAIRNGEGGQRIRELVAAGMAFAWILASRHEARMAAEDNGCSAPDPHTHSEFI